MSRFFLAKPYFFGAQADTPVLSCPFTCQAIGLVALSSCQEEEVAGIPEVGFWGHWAIGGL